MKEANPENSSTSAPVEASDSELERRAPSHVVGVGASAGGLEAIEEFFDNMPADTGLAFVVVQHLSPDFRSMMDELLARHTEMPIYRIENEMSIEANSVYLIPPKMNLVVSNGKLLLTDHDPAQSLNLPIDIFFRTLAQNLGERAVGLILSGTGSDGSRGIREIHASGGLVIVQDEASAEFDGMPRSAMATGVVDLILPPHAMPAALLSYLRHPLVARPPESTRSLSNESDASQILHLLRDKYGIDFTYYKPSTIQRRIDRRLTIRRVTTLDEYVRMLTTDAGELDSLYKDLLIGVTEFFRDAAAFDRLERQVVPQIIERASQDDTLRVWVPGCATGEEAYSLAILLSEEAQRRDRVMDIKVFATDVHQDSLSFASDGFYSETSLANFSPQRLGTYFLNKGDSYQISPALRQMVIFANHNVVNDPPFTKIDLVSCRNLLIYLQPLAQRKVLSLFHFALRAGGILFLGPSESAGELGDEFDVVDQRWRIYRKRRDMPLAKTAHMPLPPPITPASLVSHRGESPRSDVANNAALQRVYESLITKHVPPSLLIREDRQLVHVFGDAQAFLRVPQGQATIDILKMVDGDLRLAISAATHRALKDNAPVVYNDVRIMRGDNEEHVKLTVEPVCDRESHRTFLLISFGSVAPPPTTVPLDTESIDARDVSLQQISELDRELQSTKEHLQTTIEELQSTNEELVAANEELQSTNEELHSVNEELYTVNSEHQQKITELTQLTNDMDNLLRSTEIGTIFLDEELNIRKFTPAIADTINVMTQDVGRPIAHISHNIDLGEKDLVEMAGAVLHSGQSIERECTSYSGTPLLLRAFPYRTELGVVAGVVLSFVDISVTKRVEARLHESEERLELALQSAGVGTWDWIVGDNLVVWDDYIHPLFGLEPGEFAGTYDAFLHLLHPDDRDRVNAEVSAALSDDADYDTRYRVRWPNGEEHVVHAKGRVYRDQAGEPQRMTGICWDVTDRAQAETTRARLAAIVESSDDGIFGISLEGTITSWNRGAERIYCYDHSEAVGQSVSMLFPAEHSPEVQEILSAIGKGDRFSRHRTVGITKAGERVNVSLTISPIHDGRPDIIGVSVIARDITARLQAENELRRSHKQLQQMNEELRQFAYVASHDLREPLRTVQSFCELFAKNYLNQLDEKADRWIDFMTDGTRRMQTMIDDLLAYSRLDTQAQPPARIDCNETLREVLSDLKTSIDESQAQVEWMTLPTVSAEPTQIHQLFLNLIANAVKYRREVPPKIDVRAEKREGEWLFAVSDNGIGIQAEFHEKVFELLKRLHSRQAYSGTGIGLAICRKIVQRHHGRIWVESTYGEGSTFYFTLPVGQAAANRDSEDDE